MNLWNLTENQNATIESFKSEMNHRYQERLRDLGFDSESGIKCLKITPFGGPKVYQIGDSIFSLTKDIASLVSISLNAEIAV